MTIAGWIGERVEGSANATFIAVSM
jgi:hypothetical protein